MKLRGNSLAGASVNYCRVDNDFYATSPDSVRALLDTYDIEGETFYEPCVGQGHIAGVLKEYFPTSEVYGTDLIDRGYGDGIFDFVKENWEDRLDLQIPKNVDWIITNPPFKLAKEFITNSLLRANKGVAMFLKIQFLEGVNRRDWLKNTPLKYVYVFSARQRTLNNGEEINSRTGKKWATTMCFAWFIWEQEYKGEPIIRWI
jgi:hypothetical protein